MSNIDGAWVGAGTALGSKVWSRFTDVRGTVRATALARTPGGEWEYIEATGTTQPDGSVEFAISDYATNDHLTIEPVGGRVELNLDASGHLVGSFQSDALAHGRLRLRRATGLAKLICESPAWLLVLFVSVGRVIRRYMRSIYLLGVLALAVFPLVGWLPYRMSVVEAVLLGLVGFFLFSDHVARLVTTLRLRRLGFLEFGEQKVNRNIDPAALAVQLQNEFGDDAGKLHMLREGLVARTRIVLRALAWEPKPFSRDVLAKVALGLGVPDSNLELTITALLNSGVIAPTDGGFSVSPLGQKLLHYEDRISQILRQASE